MDKSSGNWIKELMKVDMILLFFPEIKKYQQVLLPKMDKDKANFSPLQSKKAQLWYFKNKITNSSYPRLR